jgi:hypothetical protein
MPVSPSQQDEDQIEEFIEALADVPEVPVFIRGIINKNGDEKVDVYYIQEGVAFTCVPTAINDPSLSAYTEGLAKIIDERVKAQTIASSLPYHNSNQPYINRAYSHQPNQTQNTAGSQYNAVTDGFDYYDNVNDPDLYGYDDDDDEVDVMHQLQLSAGNTGYSVKWDEEDPIEKRPIGWEEDPEYLQWGFATDEFILSYSDLDTITEARS